MRVIVIRPDHVDEDLARGRAVLEAEINHPAKVVMILRGDSPEISQFADKAAGRADPVGFREVVWVKDTRLFHDGQEAALFAGHDGACAVVLDLDDRPVAWLDPSASVRAIDRAFLAAQAGDGP